MGKVHVIFPRRAPIYSVSAYLDPDVESVIIAADNFRSGLNEDEKQIAIRRLGATHYGANARQIKTYQIIEAVADPKTWLFFFCGVATQVVNGAASNFGSLIIEVFGYSNMVTTLFQIPYGMVILVSNVSAMYLQRWLSGPKRCFVAVLYVCPALAGAVGIHTVSRDQKAALLLLLCTIFAPPL